MKHLNEQQKKAVTHGHGPLLIVAGAGTGKTTVITERVAWLIEQKLAKADEILALTFTDKAAGEMEERVDRLLPYGYVDLWIMTFHAFCQRVLQQHGLDIGIPNDFKLLNQTQQWMLMRENLNKFNLDYYRPLGNPTKFIHALTKHFSRCKDEEIWPNQYLEYAEKLKINLDNMESTGGHATQKHPFDKLRAGKNTKTQKHNDETDSSEIKRLEEIANAYHTYQQLLLDNESLDFGDLINYTLKLLRQRPNILKKYQQQFKYVLVDEFQDTNWAQYELVKLLLGDDKNLTVVGDDDQSIYKFRGASVSNILQFKDDFPQSQEIYLNKNYRSSQNILDMAYNFIQLNNPERLEVKLAQKDTKKLSKKLESSTQDKGIIEHLHVRDESEEVKVVVEKILELYNTTNEDSANLNYQITKLSNYQSSWNDFCILVRANNQAESFLNGLRAAEIPYNFVASKGLYAKEVIMDILAYLKLLDNYHESLALWRILNLPMVNIKTEDLMQLTSFSGRKTISLFETCEQVDILKNIEDETKRKVKKILKLISDHAKLAKEKGVKKVVLNFLEDFKYQEYLLNKNDNQAFIFLNQLAKKIDEFENSFDDKSVKNFMRLIDLELESGEQGSLSKELEEGPEAVKIITIHSAKGLEFKYVFIVNLVDKRFPSVDRKEPIELPDELVKEIIPTGDIHLQEERRLFYVAMTRAKRGVFFTSADDYGGTRKKKLSRFLYEVNISKSEELKKDLIAKPRQTLRETTQKYSRDISEIREGLATAIPYAFSYSQLKAFETCPYQYLLAFILKVPVRGKAVFSYGKTMHNTLQRFFSLIKESANIKQSELFGQKTQNTRLDSTIESKRANNKTQKIPSLEKLLELYQESWIDDWYESKEQKEKYKKQGTNSLKKLYEQLKENMPQVLGLEKGFNFKIDKHTLRGVIDRVDLIKNNSQDSQKIRTDSQLVEIIDYKTGSPKTEKNLEKDQLLIYQVAAKETFGWDVEQLTFYYLNNNSQVSFLGTKEEIEKMKNKIINEIKEIEKSDFTATPSEFKCRYCDFNSICQYKI